MSTENPSQDEACNEEHGAHFWSLDVESPCAAPAFRGLKVSSLALGESHCVLLTEEGTVYSFGSNDFGQLGLGDFYERSKPVSVANLPSSIARISCGARHSCAACDNGQLYCWGDSRQGQCGHAEKGSFCEPLFVKFCMDEEVSSSSVKSLKPKRNTVKIKMVACGDLHTIAVDSRGRIWSWGTGPALGLGTDHDEQLTPKLIPCLQQKRAVYIACGGNHSIAVIQDDYHGVQVRPRSRSSQCSSTSTDKGSLKRIRKKSEKIPFQQSVFYDIRDGQAAENDTSSISSEPQTSTPVNESNVALEFPKDSSCPTKHYSDSSPNANADATLDEHTVSPVSQAASTFYNDKTPGEHEDEGISGSSSQEQLSVSLEYPASKLGKKHTIGQDASSSEDIFHSALDLNATKDNDSSKGFSDDEPLETISQLKRQQTSSTWSVMNVLDPVEIERIGCNVPVSGSTEVWTWGKNNKGQLGTGDTKIRFVPTSLAELNNRGVVSITAGGNHTVAITSFAEVFTWGDNSKGQCAHSKAIVLKPHIVKAMCDVLVWDAAAGQDFSVFIADTRDENTELYFSGEAEKKSDHALAVPVVAGVARRQERRWKRLSQRPKRNTDGTLPTPAVDVEIRRIVHFHEEDLLRRLSARDRRFTCITSRDPCIAALCRFASSERRYFNSLSMVQSALLHPLLSTEFWAASIDRPGGEGLVPLTDSFTDLLYSVATGLSQLTDLIRYGYPLKDLFSFILADSFRAVYERQVPQETKTMKLPLKTINVTDWFNFSEINKLIH